MSITLARYIASVPNARFHFVYFDRIYFLIYRFQVERLVQGRVNKTQFTDLEKAFKPKLDETRDKMDQIVYSL